MGFFDKFKKKKEEDFLDIGAEPAGAGADFGPASAPATPAAQPGPPLPGMPTTPIASTPQPATANLEIVKKNIETLSYKFDSIKAILDNMNARLARIESALKVSQQSGDTEWTF